MRSGYKFPADAFRACKDISPNKSYPIVPLQPFTNHETPALFAQSAIEPNFFKRHEFRMLTISHRWTRVQFNLSLVWIWRTRGSMAQHVAAWWLDKRLFLWNAAKRRSEHGKNVIPFWRGEKKMRFHKCENPSMSAVTDEVTLTVLGETLLLVNSRTQWFLENSWDPRSPQQH